MMTERQQAQVEQVAAMQRAERCSQELARVLRKYNCIFQLGITKWADGSAEPCYRVVALSVGDEAEAAVEGSQVWVRAEDSKESL